MHLTSAHALPGIGISIEVVRHWFSKHNQVSGYSRSLSFTQLPKMQSGVELVAEGVWVCRERS